MPPPRKVNIAFTLAEVLITLGIIGIIAMLTIPSVIEKNEKQRNLVALKRAYNDLHEYLKMFDLDNECDGKLLNCTYTPPTGTPVFVHMFSQYLVEKQNFKPVTGPNKNACHRFAVPKGTFNIDLPYFNVCPVPNSQASYLLVSPTGNYAYYITKYMHDNFYIDTKERGVFRARMAIFTDGKRFKPCKLNCTEQEIAKAPRLGKNIFKLFISDNEYIIPQGGCTKNAYYCAPYYESMCSKNTNNYESCLQKIIQDGWQMNY